MRKVPYLLIFSVTILTFFSITALYIINFRKFVPKEVIYFLAGFFIFLIVSSVNFRVYKFYAIPLYSAVLVLLIGVLIVGVAINSSRRWISIAGLFTIQPSEFAKISLIIVLAWIYEHKMWNNFQKFVYSALLLIPYAMIVFLQPDMGTSLVFAFIYFFLILAFLHYKYALTLVILALSMIPLLPKILKPYQIERILTFFDPYRDPLGSGYNVLQSIISFSSGRLFGKGISGSTMTKLNFVPVQYADFILSAIGEIWGFIGVVVVLLCYSYILYFTSKAAFSTKNIFGRAIALGVFAMFFFQILINAGMNMGIMPVTGVPLPFLSFGGSSEIVNFLALGLSVSVYNYKDEINL
ncbi:FtsW/RodA/SpoVE family cell cycle protein [Caldisericum exile]|uniref:Rod shape-determining protein RodA n=1 Tax=Caldisericum exile (strain DSM 21853 / NBRC 104410 / AZM16c01) TaxID=511051 RepID=A0A7U6GES6_CALEA|nr:FtsW/RodA/SpoVE family cell cycle protein [Caldisericum exile]BAL81069.1 rod shape-determining protein RodA [Caldisericum exile AZM16c01]